MDDKEDLLKPEKVGKIQSFCASFNYDISETVLYITENSAELTNKDCSIIHVLLTSLTGLGRNHGQQSMIEAMKILECVFSLDSLEYLMAGTTAKVITLVIYFLKIISQNIYSKEMLKPRCTSIHYTAQDLTGFSEEMKRMESDLGDLDVKENPTAEDITFLLRKINFNVGLYQIGNLRGRISSLIFEGKHDMEACFHLLTLFVRVSTLRHSFLFRMMICMKAHSHQFSTCDLIQNDIKKERADNKEFLQFLSVPSLENVCVLAEFDPSEYLELATYLADMHLSLQNLHQMLHNRTFIVQPYMKPTVRLGRPFPSISPVRAMKDSTDIDNVRIRFKFDAVENSFNLFHIQSPDLGECLYMKTSRYCKYSRAFHGQTGALWRVRQVKITNAREDDPSVFVFCTKKQPQRFLYLADSIVGCAKGLEDAKSPNEECLFHVSLLLLHVLKSLLSQCFQRIIYYIL